MNRIDEEVDFDSDPVHNITRTLTMTDGFKIGENDVYKIDLMLSATPATSVDKTDIFK